MPTFVNAYRANDGIADSLSSLATSMFGDQSKNAVLRETAAEKARHNLNAEPFARAARDNDPGAMSYYGAMGGKTGRDVADFNLLSTTNNAKSVDDPRVSLSQIGAHEGIASTPVGQGRAIAGENFRNAATVAGSRANNADTNTTSRANNADTNATHIAVNDMTTRRQQDAAQWADEHTLVDLTSPENVTIKVPKAQVPTYQARGYRVQESLDQVKARMAPALLDGSGGGSNDARAIVGLPHFSPEQIQANARDEAARREIPDLAAPPSQFSQAQRDAQHGGGLVAIAKNVASHTLNAATGIDIAPELHASLDNLRNLASRTRALPISGVSRDSVQREKWNNENIPQPEGLFGTVPAGGEQARAKVLALTRRLRTDYVDTARLARDPSTPPAERAKLVAHLNELRSVVEQWEAPVAQKTPGAPPAAQTAAPAAAPETKMLGNVLYTKINGQWMAP